MKNIIVPLVPNELSDTNDIVRILHDFAKAMDDILSVLKLCIEKDGDGDVVIPGTATITGAFGCNSKTVQGAYASGGALSAYSAGSKGYDTDAHAEEIHALLVKVRAALVANGIMS